jgi:CBS domain-containing protein
MRIQEILSGKGSDVVHAPPDSSVGDLLVLLRDYNLGAVVVSPDGRHVAGIVSERDVVRHLVDDPDLLSRPVSSIMTGGEEVWSCVATDTVASVMGVMTERRVRHVPVLDQAETLVGIVSIGDLVKWQISQLQFERDQLQDYVLG